MSISFQSKLDDGIVVDVEAELNEPEPEVGLFGYSVDSINVMNEDGNTIETTDAELNRLCDEAIATVNKQNRFPDPFPGDYD